MRTGGTEQDKGRVNPLDSRIYPCRPSLLYRVLYPLVWWFARLFFRIEVEGAERIPARGPVVLCGTHRSNIDSPILCLATRRHVHFMAKREFFAVSAIGRVFAGLGAFPVTRGKVDRLATLQALRVLRADGVLGIFPEGTRRCGPVIGDIHRGAVWLAAHTGAVLVPVGIAGTEAAQPKGAKLLKPAKVHIFVGDPLPPPISGARSAVLSRNNELRKALQHCFDSAGGPVVA
jgi:1-acyl-sn-glycerol-3-phosphate acyltransferase